MGGEKMDKMMKECMKPHGVLHLLTGAGLGLLLASYVPALSSNLVMVGLALVVVGIAGEFIFLKR
ncbi:hypothetical protein HYS91_03330 [Candidatus Daviesbacteria bacterium]|nr:hypothetical protein [Candidatus Daviesbacteria bacterium]